MGQANQFAQMTSKQFLSELYSIDLPNKACGFVYNFIDHCYKTRNYKLITETFDTLNVQSIPIEVALAFLAYTSFIKSHVNHWDDLYHKIYNKIKQLRGEEYAKQCLIIFSHHFGEKNV